MVKYIILLLLPLTLFGQYVNDLTKCTTARIIAADSVNIYVEALDDSSDLAPYKLPLDSLAVYFNVFNVSGTSNNTKGTDSLAITVKPTFPKYKQNMLIIFESDTVNTGACAVNVNSKGWKAVKSLNNQDPADNYIETGSIVIMSYDGTNFQLLMPDANP